MLSRRENKQIKMFFGSLEELMPKEHFLRDLDNTVDFDVIPDIWREIPYLPIWMLSVKRSILADICRIMQIWMS